MTLDGSLRLLKTLATSRWTWMAMAILSVGLVVLAHNVFQVWLYMPPCEQCVYIRFAFLVMALGFIVVALCPQKPWLRWPGSALALAGGLYGASCSTKLMTIHHAVHSDSMDDVFGLQGCSLDPHYPFDIPLAQWFPDWFQPTGDCGYDLSIVPEGVTLSHWQQWFIDLYGASDSWYLVPAWKWMSMAECCLLAFGVAIALIVIFNAIFHWRS